VRDREVQAAHGSVIEAAAGPISRCRSTSAGAFSAADLFSSRERESRFGQRGVPIRRSDLVVGIEVLMRHVEAAVAQGDFQRMGQGLVRNLGAAPLTVERRGEFRWAAGRR
jgi:hypothetical protein